MLVSQIQVLLSTQQKTENLYKIVVWGFVCLVWGFVCLVCVFLSKIKCDYLLSVILWANLADLQEW